MNSLLRFFATAFIISLTLLSFAQVPDCGDCPAVELANFDLVLEVTQSEAIEMGYDAGQVDELARVSAGLFNALQEHASDSGCFRFAEGAGYQLSGTISKKARKTLLIEAWIEAPQTGERVVEAEMEYDQAMSGQENGAAVAALMLPIAGKIRAYELGRRDKHEGVALGLGAETAAQVRVSLDRDSLAVNQTAGLSVTVTDCDGTPLPGLRLQFAASGGTVQPHTALTGEAGEARVVYKAPCEPGAYELGIDILYFRPFNNFKDPEGPSNTFTVKDRVEVRPGRNLWLHYEHAAFQSPGGEFTINSTGKGVIACTIERVPDSVKVTGTGMVVVDWSSNIQDCIYSGRNNYKINCFGLIVEGEDGSRWLEIARTGQDPMGGKFTMDCNGERQEVASPFPVPDHETGRPLRFKLDDGEVNTYVDPETGSEYRYVLDLGCGDKR